MTCTTSLFDVELQSSTVYDVLDVSGTVDLSGLLSVTLLGDFIPSSSDSFTILAASSLSGDFLNLDGNNRIQTAGGEGSFLVSVSASSVTLSNFIAAVGGLLGDTNNDGVVDLVDLNNVRNNFGGSGLGDTNSDGIIDLVDLNNVRNNFGATLNNFSQVSAVPEPAMLSLLGLGVAALTQRRRRRA